MKPPYRLWRLWHRLKIAKRNDDQELRSKVVAECIKLLNRSGK